MPKFDADIYAALWYAKLKRHPDYAAYEAEVEAFSASLREGLDFDSLPLLEQYIIQVKAKAFAAEHPFMVQAAKEFQAQLERDMDDFWRVCL